VKTTLELPDELVVEIKVEAALRKKKLKELVPELLRAGLDARREASSPPEAARRWLAEWVAEGREATAALPPSPTATEIVDADRDRLETSRQSRRRAPARHRVPSAVSTRPKKPS